MCPRTTGIIRAGLILALGSVGISFPGVSAGQFDPTGPAETYEVAATSASFVAIAHCPATSGGDGDRLEISRRRTTSRGDPRRHRKSPDHLGFITLKYGTFDPKGTPDGGSFLGFRTGAEWENRLTLSFNFDAYWRSFTEETVIAQEVDPNGNLIRTSATSLETSSTLLPLGVSLGLRLPGTQTLTPFVGVGIAYEVLINDIKDYQTGLEDTNVYGGPGWQLFGGLMFPVTSTARFLGELWYNDAEVSRNVDTYEQGLPVRETIDVSGLGARFGVEFAF
jgi:hypothetical protein